MKIDSKALLTDDNNKKEETKEKPKITKEERIVKERKLLLKRLQAGQIRNIKDRVAFLLNNHIEARNSDKELTWLYWEIFEGEFWNGKAISKVQFKELTKAPSITRVRATIQNTYKLFQPDEKVKKYRTWLEEDTREEVLNDNPIPIYKVYIDETGKTQKYLSIGSLWVVDIKAATFGYFKLKDWKMNQNINYEFHFSEVTRSRLEGYKNFFLKFITLNPTVGFKVIVIDKTGHKNVNNVITDLTFHLLNKGINHENNSGRAPLPRFLQVAIDDEEVGSDKLKLENIQTNLASQNIEGLHLSNFEAVDSRGDFYIQIADLFTGSVNRKLHNLENKNKPKDKLADYILNLLDFDISKLDNIDKSIDKSKVFNLTYNKK